MSRRYIFAVNRLEVLENAHAALIRRALAGPQDEWMVRLVYRAPRAHSARAGARLSADSPSAGAPRAPHSIFRLRYSS